MLARLLGSSEKPRTPAPSLASVAAAASLYTEGSTATLSASRTDADLCIVTHRGASLVTARPVHLGGNLIGANARRKYYVLNEKLIRVLAQADASTRSLLRTHTSPVTDLALHPSGHYGVDVLASGDISGRVELNIVRAEEEEAGLKSSLLCVLEVPGEGGAPTLLRWHPCIPSQLLVARGCVVHCVDFTSLGVPAALFLGGDADAVAALFVGEGFPLCSTVEEGVASTGSAICSLDVAVMVSHPTPPAVTTEAAVVEELPTPAHPALDGSALLVTVEKAGAVRLSRWVEGVWSSVVGAPALHGVKAARLVRADSSARGASLALLTLHTASPVVTLSTLPSPAMLTAGEWDGPPAPHTLTITGLAGDCLTLSTLPLHDSGPAGDVPSKGVLCVVGELDSTRCVAVVLAPPCIPGGAWSFGSGASFPLPLPPLTGSLSPPWLSVHTSTLRSAGKWDGATLKGVVDFTFLCGDGMLVAALPLDESTLSAGRGWLGGGATTTGSHSTPPRAGSVSASASPMLMLPSALRREAAAPTPSPALP